MTKPYFLSAVAVLLLFACNDNKKTDNINATATEKISNKPPPPDIHLMARPDSVSFDAASTAIIVVDMQNDFGSKGGMFDRSGIDISGIQKAIVPTLNVLTAARESGIEVIYLKMGFNEDLSDLGREEYRSRIKHLRKIHVGDTMTAPTGDKGRILIRDTWNTDIISQLQPQPDDIVIYKTRFNGFYQTTLDSILKRLEKKYLIFTGCTTSICIESTVRDAAFRNYLPIVLEDCTAEPIGNGLPRSNHEASLLNIQVSFGWVSTSNEFIKSIRQLSLKTEVRDPVINSAIR
jgi:ureidoacrylate peracid hydrolase